uniref:EF-hand domain-containing protein n=1 Tax=Ciona savignyi TaxID=51511 RepID=H2Y6E6_CIOSA
MCPSVETPTGSVQDEAEDDNSTQTDENETKDTEATVECVAPPVVTLTDEEYYDTDLEIEDENHRAYHSMTAVDIYFKSCEQLGVVPASYFVTHLQDEAMNMSHHGLGPNGTKAIAAPLVINTSILELNLEDNWITSDGTGDIADMLTENCYISNLNISHNKLGSEGARLVCEMLQENTTLRTVSLARNEFKDSDGQYFAEALRQNFRLKELDLSGNEFCELGGEWLGQAIAANEAIETLNLSWNHLRLKGALAVCAGMKVNITIKSLDLSWNGFADEGAMAMGEAIKTNNTLTWLDLSFNRISDRGLVMLTKGLEANDTLRTLKLGNNPISEEGALLLITSIHKNERSAIEDLDLKDVKVNKEFKSLAEKLRERTTGLGGSWTCFTFNVKKSPAEFGRRSNQSAEESDPMMVMQKFLEDNRLRLVDLFRNFDKDLSWKISPAEFKRGISDAGIPFTKSQLKSLMDGLDIDADGQVNYRQLAGETSIS